MNFEVKTWGQTDIDDNAILFILLFLNLFFFSDKRPEQSIAAARASVMVYDDLNKKWVPAGSSHGLSKVTITNVLMVHNVIPKAAICFLSYCSKLTCVALAGAHLPPLHQQHVPSGRKEASRPRGEQ